MKRWFSIVTVVFLILSLIPLLTHTEENKVIAQQIDLSILIDASNAGDEWWSPQIPPYNSSRTHGGTQFINFLRSKNFRVDELIPNTVSLSSHENSIPILSTTVNPTSQDNITYEYNIMIALGIAGDYSSVSLDRYKQFVKDGGMLLMILDDGGNAQSNLPWAFDLVFEGKSTGDNFAFPTQNHPITNNMSSFIYGIGSGLTSYPNNTKILANLSPNTFLDMNDNGIQDVGEVYGAPVLGYLPYGLGTVVFTANLELLLQVRLPLIDNIFNWFTEVLIDTTTQTEVTTIQNSRDTTVQVTVTEEKSLPIPIFPFLTAIIMVMIISKSRKIEF